METQSWTVWTQLTNYRRQGVQRDLRALLKTATGWSRDKVAGRQTEFELRGRPQSIPDEARLRLFQCGALLCPISTNWPRGFHVTTKWVFRKTDAGGGNISAHVKMPRLNVYFSSGLEIQGIKYQIMKTCDLSLEYRKLWKLSLHIPTRDRMDQLIKRTS